MRRVLIADLGDIPRLGFQELVRGCGLEAIYAEAGDPVIAQVSAVHPDVVVLNLDQDDAIDVATRIATEFPAVKVVACSSEDPVMQVFPAFHHGESYVAELNAALLTTVLSD